MPSPLSPPTRPPVFLWEHPRLKPRQPRVAAVGYQGPVVRMARDAHSGEQATVLVPTRRSSLARCGDDSATLSWSEADAHQVATSASCPQGGEGLARQLTATGTGERRLRD